MAWVVVIPNEGRARVAAPTLLLVWHRLSEQADDNTDRIRALELENKRLRCDIGIMKGIMHRMANQIDSMCTAVYTLNSVKNVLPADCMKTLYYSLHSQKKQLTPLYIII